ncbi:MAG: recombinase family protein [Defluviitaleaceae bacterium]|nr:recombinase family protein [Defluviitaleaceae bacterium]MCL2262666.1 recombinase family protein [Defluviitaleaceae bacterium]
MTSTAVYVRVSTEEQVREGYSIRAQEEKLKTYAALKEWKVFSVYADEGISAKNIEGRPEIQRLIADIISGKVNNVLVYKIDRLTRSTKNLIELIDLFNQHDCAFNSLNESIDTTTATGRMFLKIVGIFAEFERENLAERVRLGCERKVKEGFSPAVIYQSYGYDRVIGEKVQTIFPQEAEIVKRIFSMYLRDDYSLSQIARTLDEENIPTKRGKKWSVPAVKLILTNPNYIGKVRYSIADESRYFEAEGKHQPIIPAATFREAQEKFTQRKGITPTKRPKAGAYFCGVLYCASCGGKLSTKWSYNKDKSPKHANYRCTNSVNSKCTQKSLTAHSKVEHAFETYISNISNFTEKPEPPKKTEPPSHTKEIKSITAEIAQTNRKATEVMDLFMADKINFDTYQQMIQRGINQREKLTARLNLLEIRTTPAPQQKISANLQTNWLKLDNEHRLKFIQKFITKIVWHKETNHTERNDTAAIHNVEFTAMKN